LTTCAAPAEVAQVLSVKSWKESGVPAGVLFFSSLASTR